MTGAKRATGRRPGAIWGAVALVVGLALGPLALDCGAQDAGVCLVRAAREQVGVTVIYDPAYRRIAYPGGDLPSERGVCTDVLVRAYRRLGVDLQVLVHEDMERSWAAYPRLWGLSRTDPSIDHRRVPNLAAYFGRHGETLPIGPGAEFRAGELVTWRLPSGVPHVGIVSDRSAATGAPLVIHNIGRGTREEDALYRYTITGRYRYLPAGLEVACPPPAQNSSAARP